MPPILELIAPRFAGLAGRLGAKYTKDFFFVGVPIDGVYPERSKGLANALVHLREISLIHSIRFIAPRRQAR
jgi:hypothetical protein